MASRDPRSCLAFSAFSRALTAETVGQSLAGKWAEQNVLLAVEPHVRLLKDYHGQALVREVIGDHLREM